MTKKIKIHATDGTFLCEREPMTREQYLAARAEWKADYAELSQKIRAKKTEIKVLQRNGDEKAANAQRTREILRAYANEALNERRIMKLVAKASYEHFKKEQKIAA